MFKLKALTAAVLVTLSAGAFATIDPAFPTTILETTNISTIGTSSITGFATWSYDSAFNLDLSMFGSGSSKYYYTLVAGSVPLSTTTVGYAPSYASSFSQDTVIEDLAKGTYSFWYKIKTPAGSIGSLTLKSSIAPMAPVPEPETYAMLLAGLGLMGAIAKRRKDKQA
jgi:hypothetical protein